MKSKKIKWSPLAKKDVRSIKIFFDKRNQSTAYSEKLIKLFQESEILIQKHPHATIETNMDNVRGYLILDYILLFSIVDEGVLILRVWDTRRDPSQLKLFLKRKS